MAKSVRITFRSEIYLEGESLEEVAKKWEKVELFSDEANKCGACEIEVVSVEDAETYDDLKPEFDKL